MSPASRRSRRVAARPTAEALEGRIVPEGTPWTNPTHLTYSFVPDGQFWDFEPSSLIGTLDDKFGATAWRREVARAFQTWASVARLDFVLRDDTGHPFLAEPDTPAQGDPRFGDIRVAGYPFGSPQTLAYTYPPGEELGSMAGDLQLNASVNWSIDGKDAAGERDLYSLALHEIGHALGLDHSPNPQDVMHERYQGVRASLSPGDIAAIQALYGPRVPDDHAARGEGTTPDSAIVLEPGSDGHPTLMPDLSLDRTGQEEWFRLVVPAGSGSVLDVSLRIADVSQLSARLDVFDAAGHRVVAAGHPATFGQDVLVSLNVRPGEVYSLRVTGADPGVFAVGAYRLEALTREGAIRPPSPVPPPDIPPILDPPPPTPPVNPPPILPDRFESNNTPGQATPLRKSDRIRLIGLTLTDALDHDVFRFRADAQTAYTMTAPGSLLTVLGPEGNRIASGRDRVEVPRLKRGGHVLVIVGSTNGSGVADYSLTIQPRHPASAGRPRKVAVSKPSANLAALPRPDAGSLRARNATSLRAPHFVRSR